MLNRRLLSMVLVLLVFGTGSATAGEWRIPLGVTYISGMSDIIDHYEKNLKADGFVTDSVEGIPIGISFQPYYEFDSGLGVGGGIGPLTMIVGDVDFTNIPINISVRYTLMSKSNTSFYFLTGIASNLASGDYVENSQAGFIGAVGVEFMRNRAVSVGIEAGYNSSTIELEDLTTANSSDTKEFEPTGLMVSIYAVF